MQVVVLIEVTSSSVKELIFVFSLTMLSLGVVLLRSEMSSKEVRGSFGNGLSGFRNTLSLG